MLLFWEKGYKATSMDSIAAHVKVNKQSLYLTFGCKQSLFLKALELYSDHTVAAVQTIIKSAKNEQDALEDLFDFFLTRARSKEGFKGCLIVNTIIEFGEENEEIAFSIKAIHEKFKKSLTQLIADGRKHRKLKKINEDDAAIHICNLLCGMLVMTKGGLDFKRELYMQNFLNVAN